MANEPERISTRIIVPAPAETQREAGIAWYELFLPSTDRSGPSTRTPVSKLEVEVTSARESRSVMKGENVDLTIEVAPAGGASAQGVEVLVNGQRALIAGDPNYPDSVTVTGDLQLTAAQRAALEQWGRLRYQLAAVIEATRNSWNCDACVVCAAAAVVACVACVGGNPAACAAALGFDAQLAANCQGACPTPSFVPIGGMAGVPVIVSE